MREVASDRVRTFTIGFTSSEFDESKFAQRVAQHLGVENTVEHMSANDLLAYVPEVVRHYDEPIVDFSLLPTMAISQMARRDVTVVLSGDGGDELFGGYEHYLATHYFDHYSRFAGHGMRRTISGLHRWLPRADATFRGLSSARDTATFFGSFANLGRYAGIGYLDSRGQVGGGPGRGRRTLHSRHAGRACYGRGDGLRRDAPDDRWNPGEGRSGHDGLLARGSHRYWTSTCGKWRSGCRWR